MWRPPGLKPDPVAPPCGTWHRPVAPSTVLWHVAPSCGTWHRPVAHGTGVLWNKFLYMLHTFIRSIPFESLTENDATGGSHMDRPKRKVFHLQKHRF